jgi:alpha-tubulin suppressor-like RCC1 family protein
MINQNLSRCTICGLTHEEPVDIKILTCKACGNQYFASDGIFLNQKPQKEIDILKNLRVRLDDMIQVNDAVMILSHSQDILKILPDDFLASYFYAYSAYEKRQPKFLYQFFSQKSLKTTEKHLRRVTNHMIKFVDIKEYELILKFIQKFDSEIINEAKQILKKRIQLEENYTIVNRDVFICHRSMDIAITNQVVEKLENEGYTCWVSERNLRSDDNDNYWRNIEEAIDHCKLFLVISSQAAMLSKDIQREILYAEKQNKQKLEYKIDESIHTIFFKQTFDGLKWVDGTKHLNLETLVNRVYGFIHGKDTTKLDKSIKIDNKNISKNVNKNIKLSVSVLVTILILIIGVAFFINNENDLKYTLIDNGYTHSLLLSDEGDLYAFGENEYGQLGLGFNGSPISDMSKIDISLQTGETIIKIETGFNFNVILTSRGRIFTWGDNSILQLGIGDNSLYVNAPYDITSFFEALMDDSEKVINVETGAFSSIAVTSKNRVISWGAGFAYGIALAPYTDDEVYYPVDISESFNISSNENVIKIDAKGTLFGLLKSDGEFYIWGQASQGTILGHPEFTYIAKPLDVSKYNDISLDKVNNFYLGDTFVLFTTNQSKIYTFGLNYSGQLASGNTVNSFDAIDVTNNFNLQPNESIENVILGYDFGYMFTSEGRVIVWGSNSYNAIFLGKENNSYIPIEIEIDVNIKTISDSPMMNFFMMISDDGKLIIWGKATNIINGENLNELPEI